MKQEEKIKLLTECVELIVKLLFISKHNANVLREIGAKIEKIEKG